MEPVKVEDLAVGIVGRAGIQDDGLPDFGVDLLAGVDTARVVVTPTTACRPGWLVIGRPCSGPGVAHIILEGVDEGKPKLTSYRRVILTVRAAIAAH